MGQQYTMSFLQKIEQDSLITRSIKERHQASLKKHDQLVKAGIQMKQISSTKSNYEEQEEQVNYSILSKGSPYNNLYDKLRSINLPRIEEKEKVTKVKYLKADALTD